MAMQTGPIAAMLRVVAILGLLTACAEKEEILAGTRLDLRAPLDGAPEDTIPAVPANRAVPIALPRQSSNAEWTHRGGSAQHTSTHPALGTAPVPVWTVAIGEGDGRKHRITAEPVVAGGRIFTMDALATVAAVGTGGGMIWSRDLTPAADSVGDASGGGLAYGGGRLFATSGFGLISALDPSTGAVLWTQSFTSPATSAPTVDGELVYVVTEDSTAWAIEAETGKVRWQLPGTVSVAGMVGGPGPAVADRLVVFPFPSGQVQGVLKDGGIKIWQANIAGRRLGRAYSGVPDITGDPVVVGNTVYIGNQSGKVAALDVGTGERIWTADEGAYGAVLPVGGSVFLISDAAQLVRLDAGSGGVIWAVDLPEFTTDKIRKRQGVYSNYGPLLAGGRLIVASGDGLIRQYDPATGALVRTVALDGAAATDPVVAGGVLYLVTTDGKLHAFR